MWQPFSYITDHEHVVLLIFFFCFKSYYPFQSNVKCEHRVNGRHRLKGATCLQQQIFEPAAYNGSIYASYMTNVRYSFSATWKNHLQTWEVVCTLNLVSQTVPYSDYSEMDSHRDLWGSGLEQILHIPLCVVKGDWMGWFFGWDGKNWGPVSL
jgi:hypothetical protein